MDTFPRSIPSDALAEVKRKKLIDAGIVKIVSYYTRDYHGRVDVKTF